MLKGLCLSVLGCRGSLPVSGQDYQEFGGATSCYLVEGGDTLLLLDAGTGLLRAPEAVLRRKELVLLLSHTHIDHILGLPLFPPLFEADTTLRILGRRAGGLSVEEQLASYISPPLWPCTLADYAAAIRFRELPEHFTLGEIEVDCLDGSHPGGSTIFRLSHGGKSLVCVTDYEHGPDTLTRLADFARDTDLLLYDGQYTEADYEARRGFGHSTAETGLALQRACGAKQLLLIHHDPRYDDAFLRRREQALPPQARFAREGDVILL